ncbi:leishmanolysin-like peptidase [Mycobacterium phage SWU1]|uniref:Leishmanolysin-like peptidase n=1 Tax=Mycobacterium phage SWU1 TaxID=1175504 RepID=I1V1I9_9CAUD|nr:leishmanolysin-like peptidase [Mycobacterium phage SWU1]AFI24967.1 leishmanolysin-like peptidase [Mycobacterium phage SWU1]
MFELKKSVFETWEEVPRGLLVKSPAGIHIKLNSDTTAYTADANSIGGWSGGWIEIPTSISWGVGPFEAVPL